MCISNNKEFIIIIILTIILLLPFCGKAFHIDDPIAIYTGRHILKSPLNPFDFDFNWYGKPQSMWLEDNPPLIYYFVAAIIYLFGETEIALHTSFLIFPVVAAGSMYFLGKRFTKWPFLCALLMITTPAFLVMSTNIMLDVPLLAFYTASIATFVYGVDKNDNRLKILSGVLMGCASMTKYTGLTLIPLLLVYVIMKRGMSWKYLWIFVIPIFIFVLWCINNIITHHSIHFIEAAGILNFKPDALHKKLVGTLSFMGGATIFPLLVPVLLFSKKRDALTYIISIFLAHLICHNLLRESDYHPMQEVFVTFFVWISINLLMKFVERLTQVFMFKIKKQRIKGFDLNIIDDIFLFLWIGGIFCLNVIAEYAAVRYVLILVPPLILLGARMVESGLIQRYKTFIIGMTVGGIIFSLVLSLSLVYSDYVYAGIYRTCAEKLSNLFRSKDNRLFFQCHWGFQYQYQYYMKRDGFISIMDRNINMVQGDILVGSLLENPSYLPNNIREMSYTYSLFHPVFFPIMFMNIEGKAGFYNHEIGFLPYTISRGYAEEFDVWKYDSRDSGDDSSLTYDFIDNLSESRIETPDSRYIVVKYVTIDGKLKRVLFEHPPSKITYKVRLPSMPYIRFYIATDPGAWEKDSDGMTFRIIIKSNGVMKKAFEQMLSPCTNKTERKWHDYSISLSEFSNREVEIILETGSGPNGNLEYDWALWANPMIVESKDR